MKSKPRRVLGRLRKKSNQRKAPVVKQVGVKLPEKRFPRGYQVVYNSIRKHFPNGFCGNFLEVGPYLSPLLDFFNELRQQHPDKLSVAAIEKPNLYRGDTDSLQRRIIPLDIIEAHTMSNWKDSFDCIVMKLVLDSPNMPLNKVIPALSGIAFFAKEGGKIFVMVGEPERLASESELNKLGLKLIDTYSDPGMKHFMQVLEKVK